MLTLSPSRVGNVSCAPRTGAPIYVAIMAQLFLTRFNSKRAGQLGIESLLSIIFVTYCRTSVIIEIGRRVDLYRSAPQMNGRLLKGRSDDGGDGISADAFIVLTMCLTRLWDDSIHESASRTTLHGDIRRNISNLLGC